MTRNHVIFGGYGGVGLAIAKRLVAAGDHVHLVGRDQTRLQAAAASLGATGSLCDVLVPEQITQALGEAQSNGPIHSLCYAVGTINLKPLGRLAVADFEQDFRVNALGAALAIQAAVAGLKASEGISSVLLFSSVAVAQGFPAHASIAMAKGAVEALTRSLATELAPKIRVNCIAPGAMPTEMLKKVLESDKRYAGEKEIEQAKKVFAGAEDVLEKAVNLALFLASDDSVGITGKLISAAWDRWEDWPKYLAELDKSDAYTLRRITGKDRGLNWGDR
ncbi:MAG: SDR family oxidoreductase [Verrucomicrobia bacterium]|nr:SDR family oxidoreductase [Verrucomicrobiota bacterium]